MKEIVKFYEPVEENALPFYKKSAVTSVLNYYKDEQDYINNPNRTMGMELEVTVYPNTVSKKRLNDAVPKSITYIQGLVKKLGSSYSFSNVTNYFVHTQHAYLYRDFVGKYTSPIIEKVINDDTCGPETLLKPVSEAALPLYKFELMKVCNHLELCFAEERGRDAGIHIHVDYSVIGKTPEIRKKVLEQYVLFNYYMNDEIVELSYRNAREEIKAAFHEQIFGVSDSTQHRLMKIYAIKIDLVNAFFANKNNRVGRYTSTYGYFNHVTFANNLSLLEVRIFGSSIKPDIIMSMYEYLWATFAFCEHHMNVDLNEVPIDDNKDTAKRYFQFVKENKLRYPHLYNRMLTMSSFKSYVISEEAIVLYEPIDIYAHDFYKKEVEENKDKIFLYHHKISENSVETPFREEKLEQATSEVSTNDPDDETFLDEDEEYHNYDENEDDDNYPVALDWDTW